MSTEITNPAQEPRLMLQICRVDFYMIDLLLNSFLVSPCLSDQKLVIPNDRHCCQVAYLSNSSGGAPLR